MIIYDSHTINWVDDELIDIVEKQGYEIVFKPHPNLENTIKGTDEKFIDLFDIHNKIKI